MQCVGVHSLVCSVLVVCVCWCTFTSVQCVGGVCVGIHSLVCSVLVVCVLVYIH